MIHAKYRELVQNITAWGNNREDIRAIVVIGSQARETFPADQWSDLDLVLVTRDVARYIDSNDWINEFGNALLSFIEATPVEHVFERRVMYEGFLDVDFVFHHIEAATPREISPMIEEILSRGYLVVLDKEALFTDLKLAGRAQKEMVLSGEALLQEIHYYLYHCVWIMKKIKRGETWTALHCLNHLNDTILKFVEQSEKGEGSRDQDTWYNGRFLEQWASEKTLDHLKGCFSDYDAAQIVAALKKQMSVFRDLALRVAGRAGFTYPEKEHAAIYEWIEQQ